MSIHNLTRCGTFVKKISISCSLWYTFVNMPWYKILQKFVTFLNYCICYFSILFFEKRCKCGIIYSLIVNLMQIFFPGSLPTQSNRIRTILLSIQQTINQLFFVSFLFDSVRCRTSFPKWCDAFDQLLLELQIFRQKLKKSQIADCCLFAIVFVLLSRLHCVLFFFCTMDGFISSDRSMQNVNLLTFEFISINCLIYFQ